MRWWVWFMLAVIGDTRPGVGVKDGVPELLWLPIEVSPEPVTIKTDEVEIGPIAIPLFFIARGRSLQLL